MDEDMHRARMAVIRRLFGSGGARRPSPSGYGPDYLEAQNRLRQERIIQDAVQERRRRAYAEQDAEQDAADAARHGGAS